jgi:Uma2 family endonuclease
MASIPAEAAPEDLDYPTSDGRPMAETDWHRILMTALIQALDAHFAQDPQVYVSGNLLVYYEPGNRRRHLSPDVFVVKGVEKRRRPNFLIWRESKGPDVVIELTSQSTREEDVEDKFELYQNTLRIPEYFLFDPLTDYLDPPLQGYRLRRGRYEAITAVDGRLPSKVLGLHLERRGEDLRLYNPATGQWLPTPEETASRAQAQAREAEAEVARLRRELEQLRRRKNKGT